VSPQRTFAAFVSLCALALGTAPFGTAAQGVPLGVFEWRTLNGRPAPAEFPPRSGMQLIRGSLELTPATSDTEARFELVLDVSVAGAAATPNSVAGSFTSEGDMLRFLPDQGDASAPVTFRYAWLPDGTLALTDAIRHVWGYERVD
jgi:hypothetical protein